MSMRVAIEQRTEHPRGMMCLNSRCPRARLGGPRGCAVVKTERLPDLTSRASLRAVLSSFLLWPKRESFVYGIAVTSDQWRV